MYWPYTPAPVWRSQVLKGFRCSNPQPGAGAPAVRSTLFPLSAALQIWRLRVIQHGDLPLVISSGVW